MAQGQIQNTKPSKSGQTLGVQIGGQWYSTKHWELQNMQGQEITFQTSVQQFPNGGSCTWLNDYTVVGASGNAADQAFNQAHAQNVGQTQPAPVQGQKFIDREASIVAQALCKSITAQTAEQAWNNYVYLYEKALNWDGQTTKTYATPQSDDVPFDDSVPF